MKRTLSYNLILMGFLASCQPQTSTKPHASASASSTPAKGAGEPTGWVARVGDKYLTEADLQLELRGGGMHGNEGASESREAALESMIREEAAAQKAEAEGQDRDPAYLEQKQRLESQLNLLRRRQLSAAYFQEKAEAAQPVTEEDIKAFYEANASQIRMEIRVGQILLRDEARINEAKAALASGKSFDEVARAQFPRLPTPEDRPWELGYMKWNQVPEAWAEVLKAMKPGDTSDVIRGPKSRYWIIHLIDRREDPGATLDGMRTVIGEMLKQQRAQEQRGKLEEELLKSASIERKPLPPEQPEP